MRNASDSRIERSSRSVPTMMTMAGACFFLLLVAVASVEGLSLPRLMSTSTARKSMAFSQVYPTSNKMASTMEDQKTLTEEEEAILFGEDSPIEEFEEARRKKDKFGNYLKAPNGSDQHHNPLDHSSTNPLVNKLRTMRDMLDACPDLWGELAKHCPDNRALLDEHMCDDKVDLTFAQMDDMVRKSAAVFQKLGVEKGKNVAILGENSAHWLLCDHGIQLAGGASAVRGADAPLDELRYIYSHSDSAGIAVLQGPKLLKKLADDTKNAKGLHAAAPLGLMNDSHGPVHTVVLMHREKKTLEQISQMANEIGVKVLVLAELLKEATPLAKDDTPKLDHSDLATIVYTSGTTGHPKGVMLTHGNLIHQTGHRLAPSQPFDEAEPMPGDVTLSLLPVWHITERTFELWMASRGCTVVYSSIRSFKNDLAKHKPQWLVLVPRVLEKIAGGVQDKFSASPATKTIAKVFTAIGNLYNKHKKVVEDLVVADEKPDLLQKLGSQAALTVLSPLHALGTKLVWSKVQDGFGGQVKVIISGGSALAGSLEQFYETAGIKICVGYGLTECSPIISYRRADGNLVTAGCAGKPCSQTQLRVVNPDYKSVDRPRVALPTGDIGVVLAKGPQVMKGYYKNPEATAAAVDKWGWFDTGDLGRINPATGDLILTGRAKDTIVLSNGENIEPTPIEDAIIGESNLVDQVMLTGQDGRRLVAIMVLSPNELANAGFLEKEEAARLQAASEKVNDPKCEPEDCRDCCNNLNGAADALRTNEALRQTLLADVARAHSAGKFRKWEQVGDVYLTLEPFAMANGQLTQSYKVKRNAVLERYENVLPK